MTDPGTSSNRLRPAIFVDRDNTLIRDPGYVRNAADVELLPGVSESIRRINSSGFPIVVVTNQSGVARGIFTEDDLATIHQRMEELLASQGASLDAIYYCPYLDGPEALRAEYRVDSDLRKPRPGMLLLASREHCLDLARSWMIGDSERDVGAGRAAGCRTVLVSANGRTESSGADFVATDFPAAVDHILNSGSVPDAPAPSTTPAVRQSDGSMLQQILDELRMIRRDRQFSEFSLGHLAGAIAQAFALCAVGWGLYAAVNGAVASASIRLLAGIAFQLIALTWFLASQKK